MRRYCKIITAFIALLILLVLIPPTVLYQAQAQTQEMTINEILSELASVSTQEESETAIRHLFDKTGVGVSGKESKYENYVLPDENVSELAETYLNYLNNDTQVTIGDTYENTKYLVNIYNDSASDSNKISLFDLNEALTELQSQATAVLDDKENPNNAFLIAIVAEDAAIPDPISVYDSTTIRSPVQEFLFSLWLHQEGTPHSKSVSGETKSTVVSNSDEECLECVAKCFATAVSAADNCKYLLWPPLVAACELIVGLNYLKCVRDCGDACEPTPTPTPTRRVFLNAIGPVSVGYKIKIYTSTEEFVKEYWVAENNIDNGYTVWDGRNSEGSITALGTYVYHIYDENNNLLKKDKSVLWEDTTPPQIMDESYDMTNNKIHFKLKDQSNGGYGTPGGYVKIEIVDSSGNLIDTIWDWRLKLGESSLSSGICDIPYNNTTLDFYQAKIMVFDVAGNYAEKTVCIPPTPPPAPTLTWAVWSSTAGFGDWGEKIKVGDFNGDGLSDVFFYNFVNGSHWVGLSNRKGSLDWRLWSTRFWEDVLDRMRVGDFNGDGKSDIYFYASDAEQHVGLSTGSSFDWFITYAGLGDPGTKIQVGDFNGDGYSDTFFYSPGDGNLLVGLSDKHSWLSWSYWGRITTYWGDLNPRMRVGDFNGDGKSDIYFYTPDANQHVGLSTGSSFNLFTTYAGLGDPGTKIQVGDFNGDGYSDTFFYSPGDGNLLVGLSDKHSWLSWSYWGRITTHWGDLNPRMRVGDFNGDRRSDIYFYPPGGCYHIGQSSGQSFDWRQSYVGFGDPGTRMLVGDFDGNGKSDVYFYASDGNNWVGLSNLVPPPSVTVPYVSTNLVVDGNLSESVWDIAVDISKRVVVEKNPLDDNTANFGVLWDSTYLYVGVKVLDSNLWHDSRSYSGNQYIGDLFRDDSVEIVIDGNHNRGAYDEHDRYFLKGWNDTHLDGRLPELVHRDLKGVLHGWASIPGGYSIEMAIPWTNLGITPTTGMTIGFSVGYNDDDDGGDREVLVVWQGGNNRQDTSGLGEIVLGEAPTAITLAYFHAKSGKDGRVTLTWETATEVDNAGFNVYRAKTKDGNYKKINDTLIPAQGNATSGAGYRYVDTPPAKGTCYYKLEDVDYNGISTMHGPKKVKVKRQKRK